MTKLEESLARNDITSSRTTPEKFESAVSAAIEEPAIGTPLPNKEVSLANTPVTVDGALTELRSANTGVTPAALAIAELGSVAIESTPEGNEPISLFPEHHVVVLRQSDIVSTLADAFCWLETKFADGAPSLVFATGPSATGDMGGLVKGVHGPRTVHVIILEDEKGQKHATK